MVRFSTAVLGVVGGILAASGAWTLYQRATTEQVPYTVVARLGEVELRRYPPAVLAETTAPTENEAFGRLFRYISGANEGNNDLAMTAPVEVDDGGPRIPTTVPGGPGGSGRTVPMTAPVEAETDDEGVRMAFYLPAEMDLASAPRPSDDSVELVGVPDRTLGVRQFSGRPTDGRVARETDRLLSALAGADVTVVDEAFFMGYDAPWTLPPLRRNEVAVEVDAD